MPPPIAVTVRPYGSPPFPMPPRGAAATIDGATKGRLRKQRPPPPQSFHQQQQIRIKSPKKFPHHQSGPRDFLGPQKKQPKRKQRPLAAQSPNMAISRQREEELLRLHEERQRLLDLATAGPSITAAATAAAFPFREEEEALANQTQFFPIFREILYSDTAMGNCS